MNEDNFSSSTPQVETSCGHMYIQFIRDSKGNLFKVLPNLGKGGVCPMAHLHSFCSFLSILLESKCPRSIIIKGLIAASGHKCPGGIEMTCINNLVNEVLSELTKEEEEEEEEEETDG